MLRKSYTTILKVDKCYDADGRTWIESEGKSYSYKWKDGELEELFKNTIKPGAELRVYVIENKWGDKTYLNIFPDIASRENSYDNLIKKQ